MAAAVIFLCASAAPLPCCDAVAALLPCIASLLRCVAAVLGRCCPPHCSDVPLSPLCTKAAAKDSPKAAGSDSTIGAAPKGAVPKADAAKGAVSKVTSAKVAAIRGAASIVAPPTGAAPKRAGGVSFPSAVGVGFPTVFAVPLIAPPPSLPQVVKREPLRVEEKQLSKLLEEGSRRGAISSE